MSDWQSRSEWLFEWLARTSVQVGLLVLLVLVAQVTLGRWLTPRWRYGLWLLVVARLMLPALPVLPGGGVEGMVAALRSGETPASAAPEQAPAPAIPLIRSGSRGARAALPAPEPTEELVAESDEGVRADASVAGPAQPASRPDARRRAAPFPWRALGVTLWLGVAGLLFLFGVLRTVRFAARLRRARVLDDPRLLALLDDARARMGVTRVVTPVETTLVDCPAVTGLRAPRLLLPPGLASELGPDELRHVFLHELAHLRRRDVPFGALCLVLQCLYWFHPLVWLAFRRLRATQESARDWEALAVEGSPAPLSYARTLLRLCEGRSLAPAFAPGLAPDFLNRGRDLKRRILMIKEYRSSTRRAAWTGGVLAGTLAWAGFTDAAQPPLPEVGRAATQGERITVERHVQPPAWRLALEASLAAPIDFEVSGVPASETLVALRDKAGINMVVHTEFLMDVGDPELTFQVADTPLREVLDLVCSQVEDLGHCVAREAVFVGSESERYAERELRFYKIDPFFEEGYDDIPEDLCTLIQMYADPEHRWSWDWDGVSIEPWNGLIVISHTSEMHAHVEFFLNRLLNREPPPEAPLWRKRLEGALAKRTSVQSDGLELMEVADTLSAENGVTILVSEDYAFESVTIDVRDISLGTALAWVADLLDLRTRIDNGAIYLTDGAPEMHLEFYEMGELYENGDPYGDEDLATHVEDLIRSHIDPESWDMAPEASIVFWKDMMLVNNSAAVHSEIRDLVAALERTFRGR